VDEESEEFTGVSKARYDRRLRDRWRCSTEGHSYCFTNTESLHVSLTERDLEVWVDSLVGMIMIIVIQKRTITLFPIA
jgi:hypothetical protein